ncbi:MAG: hypothetical protein AAGF97_10745 [Planctomycetota bacterium]
MSRDTLFEVESLERRQMMAGDVSVSVVNEDLVIRGDQDGNELMIVGFGIDGVFEIIGANGTTVNGQNGVIVNGAVDDIRINLRSGDNRLGLFDVVSRDRLDIRTGNGDDVIVFEGSGSKNQTDLSTGGGDDTIYLSRTGSRKLNVRTGSGDDELGVDRSQYQYTQIAMSGGEDELYIGSSTLVQRARANLGGGNDRFMFENNTLMTTDLRFSGGGGTDAAGGDPVLLQSMELAGVTVASRSHFIDLSTGSIAGNLDLNAPV